MPIGSARAQRQVLFIIFMGFASAVHVRSDNYMYWCVGSCDRDATVKTQAGIVLMGGGSDVDDAFKQHILWSGGGDFLVLRASGTDAYNPYIQQLGDSHSVATLLTNSRAAAEDPFVLSKIDAADAIFFAGGDQSVYLAEWQNSTMQQRLQAAIGRGVPVGGTSAGCDIQGGGIYTADEGSTTSEEALADPYNSRVTLQSWPFLRHAPAGLLADIIVDTHFMTRDRMGRLLAFAARLWKDGRRVAALGIDEQTAFTVDASGKAKLHRQSSAGGRAWILMPSTMPEHCEEGEPLAWRTAVQKLDTANNDTFNFRTLSGGIASQRYDLAASGGALDTKDPYSPLKGEAR